MKYLNYLKPYLKPNKRTVGLAIVLALLLSLVAEAAFTPHILNAQLNWVEGYVNVLRRTKPWEESSQAYLNLESDEVVLTFKVSKKDRPNAEVFLRNAGMDFQVLEGIRLEIDPETRKQLSEFLPIQLNVSVSDKKLSFYTPGFRGLDSSLIKKKEEYATGSSKLLMVMAGDKQMKFEVNDPEPLLIQATSSGQLTMSAKLATLFPILSKVDTMKIDINGDHVEGEIELK